MILSFCIGRAREKAGHGRRLVLLHVNERYTQQKHHLLTIRYHPDMLFLRFLPVTICFPICGLLHAKRPYIARQKLIFRNAKGKLLKL